MSAREARRNEPHIALLIDADNSPASKIGRKSCQR